jgi:hypothetical protein
MFPLALIAILGLMFAVKSESAKNRTVQANTGDIYRLFIRVDGVGSKEAVERLYRTAMPWHTLLTLSWQGDTMIADVQYRSPSTIKIGETPRPPWLAPGASGSVTVLSADLLKAGAPLISPAQAPVSATTGAAVRLITKRALVSGDPVALIGAAAAAETAGATRLSRALVRAAQGRGRRS